MGLMDGEIETTFDWLVQKDAGSTFFLFLYYDSIQLFSYTKLISTPNTTKWSAFRRAFPLLPMTPRSCSVGKIETIHSHVFFRAIESNSLNILSRQLLKQSARHLVRVVKETD